MYSYIAEPEFENKFYSNMLFSIRIFWDFKTFIPAP